jgi:hypothetical protein
MLLALLTVSCVSCVSCVSLVGCGDDGGPDDPLVDLHVNRDACSASCAVDRFDLFVLRGACTYAWRVGLGGGEQTLSQLALEPSTEVTVQLLGRCGSEACVRCEAWQTFKLGSQPRVDLKLKTVAGCAPSRQASAACVDCLPGPDAYCDGARRVTCPVSGQSKRETCADGCKDGSCQGCTKTTYYQDKDDDDYGDSAKQTVQCTAPAYSAERGGDCDDGEAKVHPGQQTFFTVPTKPGGSSFDYNCDNKSDREYPKMESCALDKTSGQCVGAGWVGIVPGCGQSGFFAGCSKDLGFCDRDTPMPKKQACR